MYYCNTVADNFNMVAESCNLFWIMLIWFCMR